MKTKKITGLIAPTFTPYHPDGAIAPKIIERYAAWLKSQGISGVFVNGSSGESVLLTTKERMILAETWATHADTEFKVIIHVGSASVETAKELAAHSQSLSGVYAIAAMAPNFFPSSKIETVADYCASIAAAAPQLPFYYYHLPAATGCHIKVHQLLAYGKDRIPNLAGVKYTHTDFMDMHQCIALSDGYFDVLHGHDEILINGLVLGVRGAIGTTFNFMPEIYVRMMDAFDRNDLEEARYFQRKSIDVVSVMLRYKNAIVGGKAILKFRGIDCGPCRLPLENLCATEYAQLEADLTSVGYFDHEIYTA